MNTSSWSDYSKYFQDSSITAGFTNKYFPHFPPNDRLEFASLLGLNPEKLVKPKQVHSNIVEFCSVPGELMNLDGVISKESELVLSIQVADCIPIFISDSKNRIIGLVHAGWRGVSKGIISSTVSKVRNTNDVQILLGPSMRQCCFEIGPEVAEHFDPYFQIKGKIDRTFLDMQSVVINEFEKNGLIKDQITDIKECTCCSDKYHSYRKNGKKAGRMIAIIGHKT